MSSKINFIDPFGNERFSNLRGMDLLDLITNIENIYLVYRKNLGLPENMLFGVEIEYESSSSNKIQTFIKKELADWTWKTDGSLNDDGGEITSPKISDSKKYWLQLQKICQYLKKRKVNTSRNAGGHFHIGANYLGEDIEAWINFLKLYASYEHVLFRFFYGDKLTPRKDILDYAEPTSDLIIEYLDKPLEGENFSEILAEILPAGDKYQAINFINVETENVLETKSKNTIEFRIPNASVEEVIWQNNINTGAKMMISAQKGMLDEDFLDYKLKNRTIFPLESDAIIPAYNEIDLKSALEFVDLAFTKNIDKIYFLRQYLKSFQNNFGIEKVILAKRFIRK